MLTPLPIERLNIPQELPKEPVPVPSSNPLPESEQLQAASKGQEAELPQSQPQVKFQQPSTGTTSSEASHKTTNFPPVSITKNSIIAVDVKQITSRQSSQAPNSNTVAEISSWKSTFTNSSPSNSESSQGEDGERDSTSNGTEQVGAGTRDGQEGTIRIDSHLPNQSALFNIAPYRNALLKKHAQNWHPPRTLKKPLIVLFTIDHDGQLANLEIDQSSGSKKQDKEALHAKRPTNSSSGFTLSSMEMEEWRASCFLCAVFGNSHYRWCLVRSPWTSKTRKRQQAVLDELRQTTPQRFGWARQFRRGSTW